ncbi:hypothetical protein K1719_044024 [Acacia pycnantha]|nr:hypothetical protein K1719_044024 [Acacia pycnantha]
MAMLWRSSLINVSIIEEDRQYFHIQCVLPDQSRFLLTSVYAIPHSNLRSVLWTKLKGMATSINIPWLVIGDFNDILASSERSGGVRSNSHRIKWFNDRVVDCGLSDLGFQGPRFTWKGRRW